MVLELSFTSLPTNFHSNVWNLNCTQNPIISFIPSVGCCNRHRLWQLLQNTCAAKAWSRNPVACPVTSSVCHILILVEKMYYVPGFRAGMHLWVFEVIVCHHRCTHCFRPYAADVGGDVVREPLEDDPVGAVLWTWLVMFHCVPCR